MSRPRAIARLSLYALLLLPAAADRAFAHAFPDHADPAAGSTLKAAPAAVVIHFTEALEPHFTNAHVTDADGNAVEAGHSTVGGDDGKRLTVDLKPLPAGTYKVIWHAVSVDTHKTQGSFTFTVAP